MYVQYKSLGLTAGFATAGKMRSARLVGRHSKAPQIAAGAWEGLECKVGKGAKNGTSVLDWFCRLPYRDHLSPDSAPSSGFQSAFSAQVMDEQSAGKNLESFFMLCESLTRRMIVIAPTISLLTDVRL